MRTVGAIALTLCTMAGTASGQLQPQHVLDAEGPPASRLLLSGTVLTPESRSALLVAVDDGGHVTATLRIAEGERFAGYRLVKIEVDRVNLERDGTELVIRLGMPLPAASSPDHPEPQSNSRVRILQSGIIPDLPAPGKQLVPDGDPDAPRERAEMREAAEALLQKLRDDPEFSRKVEQLRPIIRQRIESGAEPSPRKPVLTESQ
jgi:hypothetical protein